MKHLSAVSAIFGGVAMFAAGYFLLDYVAKEVTFASLALGVVATALHFVKPDAKS